MFKKILMLLLISFIALSQLNTTNATTLNTPQLNNVESAVVMDANTGNVLYALNADKQVFPASTTKIMTLLLAIENLKPEDKIKMSYEATHLIEFGSSHIALKENEIITAKDAMSALCISSANDAANGLAETIAGSQEQFANLMNEKAKELGLNNTHFMNAHGLHDKQHYTTAYDFSLLMKAGIQYEDFLNYLSQTYYEIGPTALTDEIRYLHGTNRSLLPETNQYVTGIKASKTGYTTDSGHTQVSYASKDDKDIIVTVFGGQDRLERFNTTKALFDYAFDNFTSLSTNDISFESPMLNLPNQYELQNINESYTYDYLNSILVYNDIKNYPISTRTINQPISINAKIGDVIGRIEYIQNDQVIAKRNIILNTKLIKKASTLNQVIILIISTLSITLIILILIRRYHLNKYRKRRKRFPTYEKGTF